MHRTYYNELDTNAAAWLRELIKAGLIADGDVDERDIRDVHPNDLKNYTQCHFFAGIGVWSYALRNAGWRDDRPVWTGSCPCQPFSSAGKGAAFDDERHLWPAFHHLIKECSPATLFGEQVASKDADAWIDLVQDDLEGLGYAIRAAVLPACSVGAPHIRERLFWMGISDCSGWDTRRIAAASTRHGHSFESKSGDDLGVGNCELQGLEIGSKPDDGPGVVRDERRALGEAGVEHNTARFLGHPNGAQGHASEPGQPLPGQGGAWGAAVWLECAGGKTRPSEPGLLPLAHGFPSRVDLIRGYGNAIVPQVAARFIEEVMRRG